MGTHQMRPYSIDSTARSMGRMGSTMMARDTAGINKPRMSKAYTADGCECVVFSNDQILTRADEADTSGWYIPRVVLMEEPRPHGWLHRLIHTNPP